MAFTPDEKKEIERIARETMSGVPLEQVEQVSNFGSEDLVPFMQKDGAVYKTAKILGTAISGGGGGGGTGTVTGIKIGSEGRVLDPVNGIVTLLEYEEGAEPHKAPTATEVKTALGTVPTSQGKFLKDDGTWEIPQGGGNTTDVNYDTTNKKITKTIDGVTSDVVTVSTLKTDMNLAKGDVGLGNVGNFKAVSTEASQELTDTEKGNARTNIGAGTSSFSGSYNDLTNKPTIPCADKSYAPLEHSGLGRKNIELKNGSNILTQQDFNSANTIYVIQYDFDLNDAEHEHPITIPEGCVLEFDGGSIDNGTITGNNTVINAPFEKIFGSSLSISGTWNVDVAYPEWFGPESATYTDIPGVSGKTTVTGEDWSSAIERCFAIGRTVVLSLRDYWVNNTITVRGMRSICGIASTEFAPSITMPKSAATEARLLFDIKGSGFNAKNIIFIGCYLYTDLNTANYQDEKNPKGFKFAIPNSEGNVDAVFENCTFFKLDVAVESYGRNITFTGCLFSHCISRCVDIWHHRDAGVDSSENTDTRGYIFKGCRFHTSANYRQNYNGSWRHFSDHVCIRTVKDAKETLIDNCFFDMGTGSVYKGSKHWTSIKNCTMSRLFCYNAIELIEDVTTSGSSVTDNGYPWLSTIANNVIHGETKTSQRAIAINGRFDGLIQNNDIDNWLFQGIKIQGDRAGCTQAIISGNKFFDVCDGAFIRLDPEQYHDNPDFELYNSETKYCVEVEGYYAASFTNNVARSSRTYAPYVAMLHSANFTGSVLNGNIIEKASGKYPFVSDYNGNNEVAMVDGNIINFRPYNSGSATQRPNIRYVGFVYYDTSLGCSLFWSGNTSIGDNGWVKTSYDPYIAQDGETLLETITLNFVGYANNRYWWRTSGTIYDVNSQIQLNKKYRVVFTPCYDVDLGDLTCYLIGRDGTSQSSYGQMLIKNGSVFTTNAFTSGATGVALSIMSDVLSAEDSSITNRLSGSSVVVKVFKYNE